MVRRAVTTAIVVVLALGVLAAAFHDQRLTEAELLAPRSPAALSIFGFDLENLVVAPEGKRPVGRGSASPAAPAPAPAAPAGDAVITPPPAVFEAPPAPPPPPPPVLQRPSQFEGVAPSGGTWAVIIGINDYPGGGSDLRSAVNDANDVNQALAGMGVPADHRLLLREGQATAANIRSAADWLVAHAAPDAVAVFFYGGHVRKLESTTEAIVSADGQLVTDDDLASRLGRLQARQAWIAIAGCYGGGFTELIRPGFVLTGAAPADRLAYENTGFGRSYMVEYMVRQAMIERRAPDSVQAAFAYANDAIARQYPGRQPVQVDAGSGPLDLRPAGARPAPATPSPASTTIPPKPGSPATSPGGGGGGGGGSCQPLLILTCSSPKK